MRCDARDIATWTRCQELAEECNVQIEVRDMFVLKKKPSGMSLGNIASIDGLYHFLCGYHYTKDRNGS